MTVIKLWLSVDVNLTIFPSTLWSSGQTFSESNEKDEKRQNFVSRATGKNVTVSKEISVECTTAKQQCVMNRCSKFNPNRSGDTVRTEINSLTPLCKEWLSVNRFLKKFALLRQHFVKNASTEVN